MTKKSVEKTKPYYEHETHYFTKKKQEGGGGKSGKLPSKNFSGELRAEGEKEMSSSAPLADGRIVTGVIVLNKVSNQERS